MTDILYLKPYFSHTIWGGTRLRENFGYAEPGEDIGECWGISAHPDGMCTVAGGAYDGRSLADLWENERQLFGADGDRFPLLVKIIDARENLSIQVHPDDAYAGAHENGSLGKSECWYILDCPENARLVLGHHAATRQEFADMIHENRWGELIREVPIARGDFIRIDPGTIHAITAGVMLLETQQNSDITYRVYDYDRLQNGKPRQLHIAQSIDVATIPAGEPAITRDAAGAGFETLCRTPYYSVYRADIAGEDLVVPMPHPYMNASVIEGAGSLCGHPVKKGDHVILTNANRQLAMAGKMRLILSGV